MNRPAGETADERAVAARGTDVAMTDDDRRSSPVYQPLASLRFGSAIVLLAALLAVIVVFGTRGGAHSTGEPHPRTSGVDRIAYVSLDARIISVDPDGSDPVLVSPDEEGFFTWPTWSPDAAKLVFSSVVGEDEGGSRISLLAADAADGRSNEIYAGEPGIRGLLAEGVVHYPLWSPDSRHVAFIAVTSRGLTLFVDDLGDDSPPHSVLDQGPLWIAWSPDSRYLLAHRGANHYLIDVAGEMTVSPLRVRSASYRVPAWEPLGEAVTLMSQDAAGRNFLVRAAVSENTLAPPRRLVEIAPNPAFLWSPDGRFLAVGHSPRLLLAEGGIVLVNQKLTLLREDDYASVLEIDDDLVAHFWSPDSSKIAYVTVTGSRGVLRWMVLDVASGRRWPLVDFTPSPDQLTMLQFFDQYAYSHSLWSPDSSELVFSGSLYTGAVSASYGQSAERAESRIVVTGADPNPTIRFIGDGILGFWSPR